MRALAVVHMGVPVHNAGAEWTLHALACYLNDEHGITIDVAIGNMSGHGSAIDEPYEYEGIRYRVLPNRVDARCEMAAEYDVLLTHLDRTQEAVVIARRVRRPLVHLVHNHRQLRAARVHKADLVAFNSDWIARRQRWSGGPSLVVHPYVGLARYSAPHDKAGYITLVGASAAKGVNVVAALAKLMPERRFCIVRGAYGAQERTALPNIDLIPTGPDIGAVYARTRLLLMPSTYESFGRTAIEAACSGIPTIANPTEGLVESLGPAGYFPPRGAAAAPWRAAIEAFDDPAFYAERSDLAVARARELETITRAEMDAFAAVLTRLTEPARAAVRVSAVTGITDPAILDPAFFARPSAITTTARVLVVIPFDSDDEDRNANLEYALAWVRGAHPGWRVAVGGRHAGPWRKGLAAHLLLGGVRDATDLEPPDVIVVLDADCYLDADALAASVEVVAAGAPWAIPHRYVKRWSARSTGAILAGGPGRSVESAPRRGAPGGGCVVLRAEVYDDCPLDPRFEGWGGEDRAWGMALTTLHGPPVQGDAMLLHLCHRHASPSRVRPVELVSRDLLVRYTAADGVPVAMRSLVDEARAVYRDGDAAPDDA